MQIHRFPVLLLVPCAAALLGFSCKSPDPMRAPAKPSSAASAEAPTQSAPATVPSALPTPSPLPTTSAAVAPAISASARQSASNYPEKPCEKVTDVREYTFCWTEAVAGVRDALDATVLAQRKRDTPLNTALSALLRDQEKWEKKRDARCNANDNGQKGQGLGSVGQLSVAHCYYDANRKRLVAFQAAEDKP